MTHSTSSTTAPSTRTARPWMLRRALAVGHGDSRAPEQIDQSDRAGRHFVRPRFAARLHAPDRSGSDLAVPLFGHFGLLDARVEVE
jgi:hypothetical protein